MPADIQVKSFITHLPDRGWACLTSPYIMKNKLNRW